MQTIIKTPVRVDTFTGEIYAITNASIIVNGTNYLVSVYDFNNGYMSEHIQKSGDMGMETISETDFLKSNLGSRDGIIKTYAKCVLESAVFKDCKIKI